MPKRSSGISFDSPVVLPNSCSLLAAQSMKRALKLSALPIRVKPSPAREELTHFQTQGARPSSSPTLRFQNLTAVSVEEVKPEDSLVEPAFSLPVSSKPPAAASPSLPWRSLILTAIHPISLPTSGGMKTRQSILAANSCPSSSPPIFSQTKEVASFTPNANLKDLVASGPEIEFTAQLGPDSARESSPAPSVQAIANTEPKAEELPSPLQSSIDSSAFQQVWDATVPQAGTPTPAANVEIPAEATATVSEEVTSRESFPSDSPSPESPVENAPSMARDSIQSVSEELANESDTEPEDKEFGSILEIVLSFLIAFGVLAAVLYFGLGVGTDRVPKPAIEPAPDEAVEPEPAQ